MSEMLPAESIVIVVHYRDNSVTQRFGKDGANHATPSSGAHAQEAKSDCGERRVPDPQSEPSAKSHFCYHQQPVHLNLKQGKQQHPRTKPFEELYIHSAIDRLLQPELRDAVLPLQSVILPDACPLYPG